VTSWTTVKLARRSSRRSLASSTGGATSRDWLCRCLSLLGRDARQDSLLCSQAEEEELRANRGDPGPHDRSVWDGERRDHLAVAPVDTGDRLGVGAENRPQTLTVLGQPGHRRVSASVSPVPVPESVSPVPVPESVSASVSPSEPARRSPRRARAPRRGRAKGGTPAWGRVRGSWKAPYDEYRVAKSCTPGSMSSRHAHRHTVHPSDERQREPVPSG